MRYSQKSNHFALVYAVCGMALGSGLLLAGCADKPTEPAASPTAAASATTTGTTTAPAAGKPSTSQRERAANGE